MYLNLLLSFRNHVKIKYDDMRVFVMVLINDELPIKAEIFAAVDCW